MPKLTNLGVTGDLDALMSSVEEEQEKHKQKLKPLSKESQQEDWKKFKDEIDAMSVLAAVEHVIFNVNEGSIITQVPTERIRDVLIESGYFSDIGSRFSDDVSHSIEVDREAFPDYNDGSQKDGKPKTDMEKYEAMVKNNPKVAEFIKTFDLKINKKNT